MGFLLATVVASAQENSPGPAAPAPAAAKKDSDKSEEPIEKQRVLGVLPNYRTANESDTYVPISVSRKFYIGFKDSTDYPVFVLSAALAGLGQLDNSHPTFGQGMQGFGRRYGTTLADQMLGNLMTESIMPSLFHQDPRYFRLGPERGGGVWKRAVYAATRILVTKTDRGNLAFNYSEVLGNATVAAIGNAYYPHERRLGDNVERMGQQLATDALSQVLKEFWPDIKKKWFKK